MRAAVVRRYGPPSVARIEETPDPVAGPDDVVLDVHAAAVTAGDARMRAARFPRGMAPLARLAIGLRGPRNPVLGIACSGVVRAVGERVTTLEVGDEVAGMLGSRLGAHAEQVRALARPLAKKPAGLTHADAAAVLFGGSTALHFLRDRAALRSGARVLVVGASGAVGTSAVQIATRLGAHVTGVSSAANLDLVRRLGAERAIDYRETPPAEIAERFDLVMDTVGALGIADGKRLLAEGGILQLIAADLWQTIAARGAVQAGMAGASSADSAELMRLAAAGELDPVLDLVVPLERIAEAHARVDSNRKVGNVVVTMR